MVYYKEKGRERKIGREAELELYVQSWKRIEIEDWFKSKFRSRRNLKEEEHIKLYKRLMNKAKIIGKEYLNEIYR